MYVIWAATWQNKQSECAPSEDSDQPGHLPSLIRAFAVRMKKAWVLSYLLSAQRRLWSDRADAQADLSLRWAHSHCVGFVMSRTFNMWFCASAWCHWNAITYACGTSCAPLLLCFIIWTASWQNQQNECAPSEDQPGHPLRTHAFFYRQQWLWSDGTDAQADLSLRWAHSHFVDFVMSQLKWRYKSRCLLLMLAINIHCFSASRQLSKIPFAYCLIYCCRINDNNKKQSLQANRHERSMSAYGI